MTQPDPPLFDDPACGGWCCREVRLRTVLRAKLDPDKGGASRGGRLAAVQGSVRQHVAAAQWMIDAGKSDQAAELLSKAMGQGQRIVSDLLPGQTAGTTRDLEAVETGDNSSRGGG